MKAEALDAEDNKSSLQQKPLLLLLILYTFFFFFFYDPITYTNTQPRFLLLPSPPHFPKPNPSSPSPRSPPSYFPLQQYNPQFQATFIIFPPQQTFPRCTLRLLPHAPQKHLLMEHHNRRVFTFWVAPQITRIVPPNA